MATTRIDRISLARLQQIAVEFPMAPVIERYCREHGVSKDEARVHERELKRYFVLTALHPDRTYGMKGPVDRLWHTFLLFTEMYHAFSNALLRGKGFLHHHPCTTAKGAAYPITYDGFWYDYADAFGEEPPESVWPRPSGPRRSWAEIEEQVRTFQSANPAPMAPELAGRQGFSIAMLIGYGWLWGGADSMYWRSDGGGASGCGGGGGPHSGGGFDSGGGGGGCGGGGCGGA